MDKTDSIIEGEIIEIFKECPFCDIGKYKNGIIIKKGTERGVQYNCSIGKHMCPVLVAYEFSKEHHH